MSAPSQNRLGLEKSPYLLQHRNNPVFWYPWGEAAFEAARQQEKPIFLSIGYSTCYWCHVMERDSFERSDVAEILNRDFISIKVDREERPDVDQIYMDVVVGLNGHGGWPMSVFLAPDGRPFWGGTFFWRSQFLQVLEGVASAWRKDRDRVLESAASIAAAVADTELPQADGAASLSILRESAEAFARSFDPPYGGFGGAPKFPPSQQLKLLLRWYDRTSAPEALMMVERTLESMIRGGIFDHLGGGFARYSTDERWLVPHFEKMLYDNALMAETLIEAFQVTGKRVFEIAARETLDFLLREMQSPDGGFYSAIDAGEVDKEGEFYLWEPSELERSLSSEELDAAKRVFEISSGGNFENGRIVLAMNAGASFEEWCGLAAVRKKLRTIRDRRVRPHTDDKILAAWNGVAISAFSRAAQVFADTKYRNAATSAAEFLRGNLSIDGKLCRRFRDGEGMELAFLEDYAFVIEGLIGLYESSFEERWITWARELQATQERIFSEESDGGYFASAAPELFVRKKEYFDGAIPSAQSTAYLNLLRLHGIFPEERFDLRAEKLRRSMWGLASRQPTGFSKLLIGIDFLLGPPHEIGIIVPETAAPVDDEMVRFLWRKFLPRTVLVAKSDGASHSLPLLSGRGALGGRTTAYVCRNQRCDLPVTEIEALEKVLKGKE